MLVLSRKVGERIFIGDGISVTVVRIAGGGVRLGIEAPPETPIVREEIYNELQAELQAQQAAAATSTTPDLPHSTRDNLSK